MRVPKVNKVNEYARIMLDATPLGCSLWQSSTHMIDCNLESLKLFHIATKEEFKERFFELSPERQPCGQNSAVKVKQLLEKAFKEGYHRSDWIHQTSDGELIQSEIILVRIKHNEEFIVAAYIRDLREQRAMLDAMHQVEDDLRLALSVAEGSAKAKNEFIDNVSHELLTPMNGILGFIRMALQNDGMPDDLREHILNAEQSAKDLLKLINDVLDFTEIENDRKDIHSAPFKLPEILDEVTSKFSSRIEAKGLDFNVRLPSEMPGTVIGDAKKIKQVLTSLIDNAVKFTDKGKITVRGKVNRLFDDHVEMEFYVKDTGIGIEAGQLSSMFLPFEQADSSSTRKYGGTGLGLPLAKHLITMLGGKIWAESEYEEGSTFYFSLLLGLPETVEMPLQQINDPDHPALDVSGGKKHEPGDTRLLIVEDNEINQIVAVELLTGLGYMVDTADDGQQAVDMVLLNEYHAVLMDIQMPVMDGLTAAETIRGMEQFRDLPIIALSAHSMPEDREKSLLHGMNEHLTKPIDIDILQEALDKWLYVA